MLQKCRKRTHFVDSAILGAPVTVFRPVGVVDGADAVIGSPAVSSHCGRNFEPAAFCQKFIGKRVYKELTKRRVPMIDRPDDHIVRCWNLCDRRMKDRIAAEFFSSMRNLRNSRRHRDWRRFLERKLSHLTGIEAYSYTEPRKRCS